MGLTIQQAISNLAESIRTLEILAGQTTTASKLQEAMVVINNEFDKVNARIDTIDPAQSIIDAMNLASHNWVTLSTFNAFSVVMKNAISQLQNNISPDYTIANVSSSPYTEIANSGNIYVDATAGNITIKLLPATGSGREHTIKKIDASANILTIVADSSGIADSIDGQPSIIISSQWGSETIQDAAPDTWYLV